jgi:hypothetical protein
MDDKLRKLIAWWESLPDEQVDGFRVIRKAKELLAEATPTAPASLVEELKEWVALYKGKVSSGWAANEVEDIISRYTPVKEDEPLAVIADRKGFNVECHRATSEDWRIILFQYIRGEEISSHISPTYAGAEAATRAYLVTLPDKGEKI